MRLSTKGIYALEATVALAMQMPGQTMSVHAVSGLTGVSERYLEQIFARLKKANIISSARGKQGGYRLKRSACNITCGDVLRAAEGSLTPVNCTDPASGTGKCRKLLNCPTRPVWQMMEDEINDFVNKISLSDLVKAYREGHYQDQIDFVI